MRLASRRAARIEPNGGAVPPKVWRRRTHRHHRMGARRKEAYAIRTIRHHPRADQVAEANQRNHDTVRRDVDLLTDAYQELSDLLVAAVAAQLWRVSPAAAPAVATATSSSLSIDPSTRLIRLPAVCTKVGLGR